MGPGLDDMETQEHGEEEERCRQAAQLSERQNLEQDDVDQQKLDAFLKKNSYRGVNRKRRTTWKSKYALHTAIKNKDEDMVRVLLAAGADPHLPDSNKVTPVQLAESLNKNGLMSGTVEMLRRSW